VVPFSDHVDGDRLVERLTSFDAVVAMRERTAFPAAVLERLPRLRLIAASGAQNAVIDFAAAARLGITVCGTTGWAGVPATIEHTWALILGLARQLPQHDAALRAGGWHAGLGRQLQDRVLGLVGLGNLGPLMVPVGRALGMEIVAWSENLTDARAAEVGVRRLERAEFFATADVVSVHLRLSDRSRGYVTRADLQAMRPTAFLVNTSRGPVVDEAAVLEAVERGWIAGAALDVFDQEPLPADHPLRRDPRVIMTPHVGYASDVSYEAYYRQLVEDVAAFLDGRPVRLLGQTP
jgi:phosphoglycerate dehydrogenase-like enzyme